MKKARHVKWMHVKWPGLISTKKAVILVEGKIASSKRCSLEGIYFRIEWFSSFSANKADVSEVTSMNQSAIFFSEIMSDEFGLSTRWSGIPKILSLLL